MKIIIIAFALFVAVSCDVSHVVNADGWYKDGSGYHYDKPEVKFESPEEPIPEEIEILTEEPEQEVVTEVVNDYLPPNNEYLPPQSNDYLPPKTEEAKRKRQVQGRKVYRRFTRKH